MVRPSSTARILRPQLSLQWSHSTPLLMGQELQTILDTRYRGAASAGLCLVPSYCLRYLPLPALDVLEPWLQMLPQRGLPQLW